MDLLANLIALGFTEYESKVYLALLGDYPATGYQISKKAGIPRSMVYEALGRLDGRGAVLKTLDGRATLFSPVPPDTLLDRYEQEQRDRVRALRADLHKRYTQQDEDRLWSISGGSAALAYAAKMLHSAQGEVLAVLGDNELDALDDAIRAGCQRGVKVFALLTGTQAPAIQKFEGQACPQYVHHPPLESQLQQMTHLLVVVADSRECLICNTDPAQNEISATVTRNANLGKIVRQFIWMELFAQTAAKNLGPDWLVRLAPETLQYLPNPYPGEVHP
jgi:Cd2+/Zn2+-exporting ATPase